MSGHSKWANIQRRKGAVDAKRGKIFTRLARDIVMAARDGGPDENGNPRLKLAIQKAKAENMPKDNIERAIQRGAGGGDGAQMDEITYEGYGPEGVAYLVDVLTDNKNRALAEIKNVFNRAGGSLASAGTVSWQFDKKGVITLKGENLDYEEVFMIAAEAGADDVANEDGLLEVYTPRDQFGAVEQALSEAGYEIEDAELRWEAKNETEIGVEKALANMKLMEKLEELDDVQSVSSNLMITEEIAGAFETA